MREYEVVVLGGASASARRPRSVLTPTRSWWCRQVCANREVRQRCMARALQPHNRRSEAALVLRLRHSSLARAEQYRREVVVNDEHIAVSTSFRLRTSLVHPPLA